AEVGRALCAEGEVVFEIIDGSLIEEAVADVAVLRLGGVDVVLHVRPARNRSLTAEVAQVGFLADAAAQLDRVVVGGQEGELAEAEMLAEGTDGASGEALRVEAHERPLVVRRNAWNDGRVAVFDVRFVIAAEEQLVFDDVDA